MQEVLESHVWNRVWFITCPKLRNREFFPPLGFSPGLASSTFGGEGGVRSLLYIQRSHLGFDLVGWVRVVAFILLFAVNKLEMSLICWTNCQRLPEGWVPEVHVHFTDPGQSPCSFCVTKTNRVCGCVLPGEQFLCLSVVFKKSWLSDNPSTHPLLLP